MDPVALTSVITTGVIGLANLISGGRQASKAREHERAMARAAEEATRRQQTVEVHLALARWCYGLQSAVGAEHPSADLMRAAMRSEDLSARVLVYASPRVRTALPALDATLTAELGTVLHWLDVSRREAANAFDAEDWERMAAMRSSEQDYLEDLQPMLAEARKAVASMQDALAAP